MADMQREIAETIFQRNQRREAEINDALKQEYARSEAAVKNMYRLRALRIARDEKAKPNSHPNRWQEGAVRRTQARNRFTLSMAEIALRYEGKKVARKQGANRATVLPCRPMQSEFRSWHNNTIKHRSYFGSRLTDRQAL